MYKSNILLISMLILALSVNAQSGFKAQQLEFSRVKTAYKEKEALIKHELKSKNLSLDKIEILILAYKKEAKLELWVRNTKQYQYKLIKIYDFSAFSGKLGPKRKQGDGQIPEGFYSIDRFNPSSDFYLSLGLNYPNASDKKKSKASDLGGDVFIHGSNVTIGCIPITDDKIKELYLYAIEAKNNGQKKIQVAIFPAKLDNKGFDILNKEYKANKNLLAFWEKLKEIYDYFQIKKQLPMISVDESGDYIYK